jgi:hypothetical protein
LWGRGLAAHHIGGPRARKPTARGLGHLEARG